MSSLAKSSITSIYTSKNSKEKIDLTSWMQEDYDPKSEIEKQESPSEESPSEFNLSDSWVTFEKDAAQEQKDAAQKQKEIEDLEKSFIKVSSRGKQTVEYDTSTMRKVVNTVVTQPIQACKKTLHQTAVNHIAVYNEVLQIRTLAQDAKPANEIFKTTKALASIGVISIFAITNINYSLPLALINYAAFVYQSFNDKFDKKQNKDQGLNVFKISLGLTILATIPYCAILSTGFISNIALFSLLPLISTTSLNITRGGILAATGANISNTTMLPLYMGGSVLNKFLPGVLTDAIAYHSKNFLKNYFQNIGESAIKLFNVKDHIDNFADYKVGAFKFLEDYFIKPLTQGNHKKIAVNPVNTIISEKTLEAGTTHAQPLALTAGNSTKQAQETQAGRSTHNSFVSKLEAQGTKKVSAVPSSTASGSFVANLLRNTSIVRLLGS